MKFSESWLRTWVNPSVGTQELVDQLTMAGLEVDAIDSVAGEFSNVVVGEILEVIQHPDADKLRVCQVAGHPEGTKQVVCGAPNARVGIKIPFALVGASLPPGDDGKAFKIKKAKLRGVESLGMLCGQTELQAGDDDTGLWELASDAPVGTDLREYLDLNDTIIEVDLTPNRSDCLSLKGLAREVGVLNKVSVNNVEILPVAHTSDATFPVSLDAGDACPRYVGRVIQGVDVSKPSPHWLVERLRRSGVRSIDAVVDVTNYILMELGQPMHAFDLATLNTGIRVRLAEQGEQLTLLDGQAIKLNAGSLVIADNSGPIALAGVMGGQTTSVTSNTHDIFLESAFFNPIIIAGKARSYGLHTDSSHRFERGVDYNGAESALERATALLLDIVGGTAGPLVKSELTEALPPAREVTLQRSRIESGLGLAIPDAEVVDILTRLGLSLSSQTDSRWTFSVPSYRFDIAIEADLLEELARIYGYNQLPVTEMRVPASLPKIKDSQLPEDRLARQLIGRGYQEAITYSFIDPKIQALFTAGDTASAVELLNPISADMSVMRTSLLPGLVETLRRNLNRQHSRVRLFEKGLRFIPTPQGLAQTAGLAGLIYGQRDEASWVAEKSDVDFYDIKGDLESLLSLTSKTITFQPVVHTALHPGQSAEVFVEGESVGVVGAIHPQLLKALDITKSVFVFEVALQKVLSTTVPVFEPLSKFPEVSRDLAIVVDRGVNAAVLLDEIRANAGDYLKNLKVFDVYSGEGIDPKRKSLAFNLTFQHPSRTLNEDEINTPVADIIKRLEDEFNASLR
ncbi:phenylalanine--tRNA ligase subunit beta [Teredinibacter purpureus]|uniref:phenylalanine--tRNA ligase subunit beta n=1 Tax=Teredinibacter purpureus TaxID=2731756 RepID=UPI0005F7B3C9|nr:phenylalanine--tRNA ligase subunit beta [Teredinibacter purpureus]